MKPTQVQSQEHEDGRKLILMLVLVFVHALGSFNDHEIRSFMLAPLHASLEKRHGAWKFALFWQSLPVRTLRANWRALCISISQKTLTSSLRITSRPMTFVLYRQFHYYIQRSALYTASILQRILLANFDPAVFGAHACGYRINQLVLCAALS